jgi:hypothetical protein
MGKGMDKKLLICGSAIAVVVLVTASLSPAIGYNTVKSSVKDSPLFNVRTKRAIDEDENAIVRDYVGKNKGNTIPVPTLNGRNTLFQKFIDSISMIDNKGFNRFVGLVINHVHHNDKIENEDVDEIIASLHMLRGNPEEGKKLVTDGGNKLLSVLCTNGEGWEPGCFIIFIIDWLFFLTLTFFYFIVTLFFGDTFCVPFDTYCWCQPTKMLYLYA